jgi:DnaK suppressor protein
MRPHLNVADQKALKAMLEARREDLAAQRHAHLAGRTRAEQARDLLLQDADDATQRDADREVDLAMADREVVGLAAIDSALDRLAKGSYGDCVDCGSGIPLPRLKLAPEALRCVACEGRLERQRPHTASM